MNTSHMSALHGLTVIRVICRIVIHRAIGNAIKYIEYFDVSIFAIITKTK